MRCHKQKIAPSQRSPFQKILHCAAKDLGKAENRFRAGFIDILVVLLVHLDRPEADTASPGKLRLRAAVGRADAFEIGIRNLLAKVCGVALNQKRSLSHQLPIRDGKLILKKRCSAPGGAAPVLQAVTEVEVDRVFGDPELLCYEDNAIFQVKDPAVA